MKVKHKEARKRIIPSAKDHCPLRVFLAVIVFCGIIFSASLFYHESIALQNIKETFHYAKNSFAPLENLVTGAAIAQNGLNNEKVTAIKETAEASGNPPIELEQKIELLETKNIPEDNTNTPKEKIVFFYFKGIISNCWIISIISAFLLLTLGGGLVYHHHKSKYLPTYPSIQKPLLKSIPKDKVEALNHRIKELKKITEEPPRAKIIRQLPSKEILFKNIKPAVRKTSGLRPAILETTPEKLKLDQELVDLQSRLSRLDQEQAKPIKIVEEIPSTRGFAHEGETETRAERKEFEGLSKILLYGLKRPYLLLKTVLPHHKSQREIQAEEFAKKEVREISRKMEGNKPRPLNELEQLEEEIRKVKGKLKED